MFRLRVVQRYTKQLKENRTATSSKLSFKNMMLRFAGSPYIILE